MYSSKCTEVNVSLIITRKTGGKKDVSRHTFRLKNPRTAVPVRLNSGLFNLPQPVVTADVIILLVTAIIKMALRPGSGGGSRYFSLFKYIVSQKHYFFMEHSPPPTELPCMWRSEAPPASRRKLFLLWRQSDEMAGCQVSQLTLAGWMWSKHTQNNNTRAKCLPWGAINGKVWVILPGCCIRWYDAIFMESLHY